MPELILSILPDHLAVCQADPETPFPDWLPTEGFWSLTKTSNELSLVVGEVYVPEDWKAEKGWRCLKVIGPLDFSMVGVLSSLAKPLADVSISIFVISTYDTDYLLVRQENLDQTVEILSAQSFISFE